MADFTSFTALANSWEKKYSTKKVEEYVLPKAGVIVQRWIRNEHGKAKPRNSLVTQMMKGSNNPLFDTGTLSASVAYDVEQSSSMVSIYSDKNWLAEIHEWGATIKLSDKQKLFFRVMMRKAGIELDPSKSKGGYMVISPRIVWRRAVNKTRIPILDLVSEAVGKYLTND